LKEKERLKKEKKYSEEIRDKYTIYKNDPPHIFEEKKKNRPYGYHYSDNMYN